MRITESQLRKNVRLILSEILGMKAKKGGTTMQRALGSSGGTGGSGYGTGDDYYAYDDDDAAYDIDVALDTDDSGLDD